MEKSLQQEAWETLSAINVNDKTEIKGEGRYALTYLSWAWAWGVLMQYYPESEYRLHEDKILPNGSVIVGVTLILRKGEKQFERYMWLPVMDHKNAPVINPTSTQLNKTYMRCLAKAIAMCGLGHYIYAGEDVPNEDDPKPVSNTPYSNSTQTATPSTPAPQAKKKTFEEIIKGRLDKCQNKDEVAALYDQLEDWVKTHHPNRLDEFNLIYNDKILSYM